MMADNKPPRLTVYLPEQIKIDLQRMAKETGISQTQLVVMATHALLANYEAKSKTLFAELLNLNGK